MSAVCYRGGDSTYRPCLVSSNTAPAPRSKCSVGHVRDEQDWARHFKEYQGRHASLLLSIQIGRTCAPHGTAKRPPVSVEGRERPTPTVPSATHTQTVYYNRPPFYHSPSSRLPPQRPPRSRSPPHRPTCSREPDEADFEGSLVPPPVSWAPARICKHAPPRPIYKNNHPGYPGGRYKVAPPLPQIISSRHRDHGAVLAAARS